MQTNPIAAPIATAAPISTLPLPELAAFEAAARLGSFAKAASELCITDSAVSHRIRHLESRLAVPLFERSGGKARLLPAGERFAACIADSLDRLRAAAARIDAMERRLVRIAVAPAIGSIWLLPRLSGFRQRHPAVDFEVASIAAADFESGFESDLLIHYGSGMPAAGEAVALCSDDICAVCAPGFMAVHGPFPTLDDFTRVPLLRHQLLSWASWFEGAFGRAHEPAVAGSFDDAVSMLEAAAAGMGLSLSTSVACERYLADGSLVRAHPHAHRVSDYRAQLTASGAVKPAARAFFAWLADAGSQDEAPGAPATPSPPTLSRKKPR
jgi:LysR family transcriptional regulator, glycine cleavage system transcriptional activator